MSVPGLVFGSKDNFIGLGVFVDTYPNEEKQQEVRATPEWLCRQQKKAGEGALATSWSAIGAGLRRPLAAVMCLKFQICHGSRGI